MKLVAKCSTFVCLSYQAHVKVCNPIPLQATILLESAEEKECVVRGVDFCVTYILFVSLNIDERIPIRRS